MGGDAVPTAPGFRRAEKQYVCALCGRDLGGRWAESHLGDRFCLHHCAEPACELCAAPIGPAATGPHCGGCAATAVRSLAELRAYLPTVRAGLHHIGLRLRTPIQVRLVAAAELDPAGAGSPGTVHGLTHLVNDTATLVAVRVGLPRMQFGAAVAHESMHVWISQHGFPPLPLPVEEGLCQLVADRWLQRQSDPRAVLVRKALATSRDPVYGDGFRAARVAMADGRMRNLLRHVRRHGALP